MSNFTIQEQEVLIAVTAKNFESPTVVASNFFLVQDKKAKFLNLCKAVNLKPISIDSDTIEFARHDVKAAVSLLKETGFKVVKNLQAETSSVQHLVSQFKIEADYKGFINMEAATKTGETVTITSVEIPNMDESDVLHLMGVFKDFVRSVKVSPQCSVHENGETKLLTSSLEELRALYTSAINKETHFSEVYAYMDNQTTSVAPEVSRAYVTNFHMTLPDGRKVSLALKEENIKPAKGDVFSGPHPKFLPVRAGTVDYKILDVDTDFVQFDTICAGKKLNSEPFKFTKSQFENLSYLYSFNKAKTAKAFNVNQREAFKEERKANELEVQKHIELKEEALPKNAMICNCGEKPCVCNMPNISISKALGLW